MDIVKLEDVNITVKTIEVNGKKMSKSFFKQIPFDVFIFHKNPVYGELPNMGESYESTAYDKRIGYVHDEEYTTRGNIIGYVNFDTINSNKVVGEVARFQCSVEHNITLYQILFINKKGELKKSYINQSALYHLNIEQIFI